MSTLAISDNSLSWKDFIPLLNGRVSVKFSSEAKKAITNSRKNLEKTLKTGKNIYGVNTGFGKLSSVKINPSDFQNLDIKKNFYKNHIQTNRNGILSIHKLN